MWRTTPGRSPSRASRAAVSASSGGATPGWRTEVESWSRRYIAWSVRTWRSSPEWLDAISASSSFVRSRPSTPSAVRSASRPNGLTALRRFTTRSGSPMTWSIRPDPSTSTMSPRWTASTTPLRICRTRIGGAVPARDARPPADRLVEPRAGAVPRVAGIDPRIARHARIRPTPDGVRRLPAGRPARRSASARTPVATWPTLHVSQHPAVRHKLGILRDEKTEPKKFREVVRELSWLLGYEALADARMRPVDVKTPLETMAGEELADRIGLIPILRAGLGMVDAMLELMPTAEVWHLGLFRDERTLRPVEYYNKLPDHAHVDLCLILDPMLATGGSATAAIEVLKRWGAERIKLVNLIAAPEGVEAVATAHPDVEIYTASLDRQLNDKGYIQPGLGDAGDRQFGTGHSD